MKAIDWAAEATRVLDGIEQALAAGEANAHDADDRQAVRAGRVQVAEARAILSEAPHWHGRSSLGVWGRPGPVQQIVAEAVYRAAWAALLALTPWALDEYQRIDGRRRGGLAKKPTLAKRRGRVADRVRTLAAQYPKNSAAQLLKKYETRGWKPATSERTIHRILASK